MDIIEKQKFIFGSLFLLANKIQVIGDAHLAEEDITTKQWFLIVVISQFGEKPPMLTEVANLMGSSRQNVKQIALKLQEKGFLNIEKDEADSRALRLRLTDKNQHFWETRQGKDRNFIMDLFKNLSAEDINIMYSAFNKLLDSANNMKFNKSIL